MSNFDAPPACTDFHLRCFHTSLSSSMVVIFFFLRVLSTDVSCPRFSISQTFEKRNLIGHQTMIIDVKWKSFKGAWVTCGVKQFFRSDEISGEITGSAVVIQIILILLYLDSICTADRRPHEYRSLVAPSTASLRLYSRCHERSI